jgi:hypothetical protein
VSHRPLAEEAQHPAEKDAGHDDAGGNCDAAVQDGIAHAAMVTHNPILNFSANLPMVEFHTSETGQHMCSICEFMKSEIEGE